MWGDVVSLSQEPRTRPVRARLADALSLLLSRSTPVRTEDCFVAVSVFEVRNDTDDAVEVAFRHRPHVVDGEDGFLSMEVLRNVENPKLFWLVTRWTTQAAYSTWHHGHTYRAAHSGMPPGLKLVPGSAAVHAFASIAH